MTASLDLSAGPAAQVSPSPATPQATVAKPAAPVKLNFTTTDKASTDHGIKCLVYGRAGTGKTTLCGTMPKPIIISAEAGLLSLRGKSIPVITVTNFAEVDAAYDWVKDNAVTNGLGSVCLDSISEIAEQCLQAERAKTKDPRQAYGEMAGRTIELVKKFRDLPGLHCLITAKETVTKDPVTGVEKAQPTSPGQQVGPALPYLFDEVFHAYTDKNPQDGSTYHALRTHAAYNAEAKDRSGVLDEIEYPDMTNVIGKILPSAAT